MHKALKKNGKSKLSWQDVGDVCELWRSDVSIGELAKLYKVKDSAISQCITKHYLGVKINKTYTITIASSMNDDEDFNEENL